MSFDEILREIRSGTFHPIYFLHGEEPYYIDLLERSVEEYAMPEAERGFNYNILYGKDMDHLTLLDYLRRYPMMSERQVVVLREAQDMKGLSELLSYVEKPMPSTVFVVCYKHKKFDMGTKLGKALKAGAVVLESKRLYDNQLPDWIVAYCKSKKLGIDQTATLLLAEYLGADLSKVSNELDKLALNLPAGATITPALVQDMVGISKDYNIFELQKALAHRDVGRVMRIQQYFAANIRKNPLIPTISGLYAFFSKVYMLHFLKGKPDAELAKALGLRSEWFLKDYKAALQQYPFEKTVAVLSVLRKYDLRSKGIDNDTTSTGDEALMQELFFHILH